MQWSSMRHGELQLGWRRMTSDIRSPSSVSRLIVTAELSLLRNAGVDTAR